MFEGLHFAHNDGVISRGMCCMLFAFKNTNTVLQNRRFYIAANKRGLFYGIPIFGNSFGQSFVFMCQNIDREMGGGCKNVMPA